MQVRPKEEIHDDRASVRPVPRRNEARDDVDTWSLEGLRVLELALSAWGIAHGKMSFTESLDYLLGKSLRPLTNLYPASPTLSISSCECHGVTINTQRMGHPEG
jgi:hypothetical protein